MLLDYYRTAQYISANRHINLKILMVRKTTLFNVFGRSPIKPMQAHMAVSYKCASLLLPFFEAIITKQWEQAKGLQQQIIELEHEADAHKRDLRLHLPNNLFLPVARTDLLEIILLQDKIANQAKDIAGLLYARKMHFPELVANLFIDLLKRCLDACSQAQQAINELDELLETGFGGNEVQIVETMIEELIHIEHDTDELQSQIYQSLFKIEQELPPVEIMFLYKAVEWIGELANHANSIGGQLQLLLAS